MKFLWNFPAGLAVGAILAFSLALAVDLEFRSFSALSAEYLFTAVITLFVAAVALAGVRYASAENARLQSEQFARKHSAALAMLPIALSDMMEVCRHGVRASNAMRSANHDEKQGIIDASLHALSLNENLRSVYREIIESGVNPEASNRLKLILRMYQIVLARWTSAASDENLGMANAEILSRRHPANWAAMYGLTGTLFEYARGTSHALPNAIESPDVRFPIRRELGHQAAEDYLNDMKTAIEWFNNEISKQA